MDPEKFVFEKRVYLSDTNALGSVYFARYFELQGMAREEFFRLNVSDHMEIMNSGIKLVTKNAWMVFEHEAHLFEEVQIRVQTADIKTMSLELVFTFINKETGLLLGRGGEKIAFTNGNGNLVPIPDSIKESAKRFATEKTGEFQEISPARILR